MSLGQNIKRLRWEAGLQTQKALADLLGVPQPQVSDWENDRYAVLETLTLVKIAKGLRCSVDHLLSGVDPDYDRVREATFGAALTVDSRIDSAEIPVIAEGDAFPKGEHDGSGAIAAIVHRIARPRSLQDPYAYGVKIRGDSMLPAHRPNMIAIVCPGLRVHDGDEVYVELASRECAVRLVHTMQGGFMLQPYNSAYTACFAKPKDVRAMHVIMCSRRREF